MGVECPLTRRSVGGKEIPSRKIFHFSQFSQFFSQLESKLWRKFEDKSDFSSCDARERESARLRSVSSGPVSGFDRPECVVATIESNLYSGLKICLKSCSINYFRFCYKEQMKKNIYIRRFLEEKLSKLFFKQLSSFATFENMLRSA